MGGVIELRKVAFQDADSMVCRRKATRQPRYPRVAKGDVIIVRYADDLVMGFQQRVVQGTAGTVRLGTTPG
jgi:hypothetical protein